ncbi:signal recognition particle receptor subunit beta [Phlebotomus argentipes]|uniref:signal recognition particle receptor subunit beta n=1 Tax=Phlebotomus argentipes TaxID=94469 RepID=UPI0028935259|nr:signal recognition particle receptor subunit beta [Phlebotomus argentipes]
MDKASHTSRPREEPKFHAPDTATLIYTLIAVFITIVLLYVYKKKKTSRTDVLLMGLCEAGKTSVFTRLIYREDRETFTSIKENIADYTSKNGFVRIVDIPGHERLRGKFDEFKHQARGVVFVVDSVSVQKSIRDVADYLYTVLLEPAIASLPFLILCNKQDETMAKSAGVIKSMLEKELNLVRSTRKNQLESVDSSAKSNVFLGKQGKDFEFIHISQYVDVLECSVKNQDIGSLTDWLDRIV